MRLHRWLDGEGPQPFEHYLGRLCEEFHCLPSEAWRESLLVPVGFLEQIIEFRAYTAAFYANQADPEGCHRSAMRQLAMAIEFEIAQADLNAQ